MKTTTRSKATARSSTESLKVADDDRKVGKRKAAAKPAKSSKIATKKAKKDPNKPKRAPSAFFVFLEEFRKTFKKENPNVKAVSAVGKAAGLKWKSMTNAEKAPFAAKAAEKQVEYEKQMKDYNEKQESVSDAEDEESDKSKSEVEEATAEEDEEEDDDNDEDY